MEAASKFKAAEVPQVPDAGVSAAIAEEEDDGEEFEADGVKEKDIKLVMTQANVSRVGQGVELLPVKRRKLSKIRDPADPRQPDCGLCRFCLDRICFGGEGKLSGECVHCVSLVDASFTGLKDFDTNAGYPDNDGFLWKHFQKKKKNMRKFQCTRCEASKFKFKRKTQLKQTWLDARNGFTVKYEWPHANECQPSMQNMKLLL